MFQVTQEKFEQFVAEAIDSIPDNVAKGMRNVAFVIEDDDPDGGEALGAYEGIPIPSRQGSTYPISQTVERPDRIVLYKHPIERACGSASGVRDQVRRTLYEQVAQLFGLTDAELTELGWVQG